MIQTLITSHSNTERASKETPDLPCFCPFSISRVFLHLKSDDVNPLLKFTQKQPNATERKAKPLAGRSRLFVIWHQLNSQASFLSTS